MRSLVIGASGMTGAALMRALSQAGFEPMGTAMRRTAEGRIALDVTDAAQVSACFDRTRPEIVFLPVNAPGGVDYCEAHPDEAAALHVDATRRIARLCAKTRALLVYYSTDYVFDGTAGPYAEDAPPNPISAYGRVKLEAERVIAEEDPDHLILRTTAVYGWDRQSKNFAMQVWERLSAHQSMRVPADQICNPTLADYLAEASIQLVRSGSRGIFNVVGRDRMSRAQWGAAIAGAMGLDASLIEEVTTNKLGQQAARPLSGGLTTEKLTETLGTEPLDLQASLSRFRRQWRADTHQSLVPSDVFPEARALKQEIFERVGRYCELAHQKKEAFVPFKTRIGYAGRVFGAEEMVNLVDSALDFWLTMGPYGEQFEQKMKRFFGAKDFAFVNSGSAANLTAVMALMSPQWKRPLRPGDEVITPAVTFPTTLAPLADHGLVPVLVDCELGTYNIDPSLLESAVSERTRAIFIPHTLGNPCDMHAILQTADRHGLDVIEDCCDALGSTFEGRPVGTFGRLATLSFFPAHHITTGEGGGVVVNDARLTRIVKSVRDWGRDCWCAPGESNTCGRRFGWQLGDLPRGYDHKYTYSNLGYNFKATDMQAAIGVAQMDRLEPFIEKRRSNFQRLYEALKPYEEHLVLPKWHPLAQPAWFGFPITVKGSIARAELIQWLERANIETRQVFGGNILRQPAYRHLKARIHGSLEQSDRVMRDTFFIGVYPGLTEEMLAFVIERFRAFFAQQKSCRPSVAVAA